MKHYIEITLIQNAEIPLYFIWSKLYTQLHLALVEIKDSQERVPVGVSFPNYRYEADKQTGFLGDKLRIFANDQATLERLDLDRWFARLRDYIHQSSIRETPLDKVTQHTCFARKSFPSVAQKAHSRAFLYAKWNSQEQVNIDNMADQLRQTIDTKGLPFVSLQSLSGGHDYRLHITQIWDVPRNEAEPVFSTYGLSRNASVPIF